MKYQILKNPTKKRLTIELIPKTSWFKNLRSELSTKDWDKIRKTCYKLAGYRCQICGGVGPKWPVECHEVWKFERIRKVQDIKTYQQTLKGLIALCPLCHQVKHIGYANKQGKLMDCITHLMKVNQCSQYQAEIQIQEAFILYLKRSKVTWDVNIGIIL
jgi:hypothetical protein